LSKINKKEVVHGIWEANRDIMLHSELPTAIIEEMAQAHKPQ